MQVTELQVQRSLEALNGDDPRPLASRDPSGLRPACWSPSWGRRRSAATGSRRPVTTSRPMPRPARRWPSGWSGGSSATACQRSAGDPREWPSRSRRRSPLRCPHAIVEVTSSRRRPGVEITISSRGIDLSDALVAATNPEDREALAVPRDGPRPACTTPRSATRRIAEKEICEVVMEGHGHQVQCKVAAVDGLAALDLAVEKLEPS